MLLFRKLSYKIYQRKFCRQYIKRSKNLKGYEGFLKHISKSSQLKNGMITISIYDVLNNDGMNQLIRKIYRIKKDKSFLVKIYFRRKTLKKLNYVNANLSGTETGLIGDITFKTDKWISNIELSYTYVNNSEVIIQYKFCFKHIINTFIQIHNFILDNILRIRKGWYFHTYADKTLMPKLDYREMLKLEDVLFGDILQGIICTIFYTRFGRIYKLPIEYNHKIHRYNFKRKRRLRNAFLRECYEYKKEFIIVSTINDRFEVDYFNVGKYFKEAGLLYYFRDFSTEMYYKAFYKIEIEELRNKMQKYLNSRRNFVSSKDIKWLINKIRYIREKESGANYNYHKDEKEWIQYIHGKKKGEGFVNNSYYTSHFRKLYEQNLDYLNSIAALQNNKVIIFITVATLIFTVIGVMVALLNN